MRKYVVIIGCLLLAFVLGVDAQAANIHMHYFESVDVLLDNESFQLGSVSVLAGEKLTIVAAGLDGVVPGLTLLDPSGSTVAEDLNQDQGEIAWVQITAPANGMYTFLSSRQSDVAGYVRLMVFEGEPIVDDTTLLDTLDPFAPSRAFMIGGSPDDPINVMVDVLEPEDENIIIPEVYTSRGTAEALPPLEDMTTPLPIGETESWHNADEMPFYTIYVRPFPEVVQTSRVNGWFHYVMQSFDLVDYEIIIGEGGEPIRIVRQYCTAGGFEITGISDDGRYYQLVDTASSNGYRLIPVGNLTVNLDDPACNRVQPVQVDTPPVTGGGGSGGGFPIPPAGDPPPAGTGGGNGSISLNPPGNTGGGTGNPPPANVFSVGNWSCSGPETRHLVVSYFNAPNSMTLTVTKGSSTSLIMPAGSATVELTALGTLSATPADNAFSYTFIASNGTLLASGNVSSVDCAVPPPAPALTVSGSCNLNSFGFYEYNLNWSWSGLTTPQTQLDVNPDLFGSLASLTNPSNPGTKYVANSVGNTWAGTVTLQPSGLTATFNIACSNAFAADATCYLLFASGLDIFYEIEFTWSPGGAVNIDNFGSEAGSTAWRNATGSPNISYSGQVCQQSPGTECDSYAVTCDTNSPPSGGS